MKKLLALFVITGCITACSNNPSNETGTSTDTSSENALTQTPDTTSATTASPVKDSIMQFQDGKVLVVVAGNWSPLTAPVIAPNGRKISPNGDVTRNGKSRRLIEGMRVNKDGQLMDNDGNLTDTTGW